MPTAATQIEADSRHSTLLTRFFLIAFGLCWLITILIALQVQGLITIRLMPVAAQWLIGFAPLLAAAWVTRGSDQRGLWLAGALRLRVSVWWYILAVALPWLILGVTLVLYALTGRSLPRLVFGPQLALFGLVWIILAYGEEAGWRTFALPQLWRTHSFWLGSTILGILWCIWHYPKLYANPFLHLDTNSLRLVAQFSVQILVANYLLAWIFLRSRSAVITALFHGSWNLVATVYALAATDPLVTLPLAGITALVLYLDRGRLVVSKNQPRSTP